MLVDLVLPDSHGIDTFDRLFRAAAQIPILVLTASQDEDIARLAVQHGAQDYLLKTRLDNYLLPKALRSMVERAAIAEVLYQEQERARVTLDSIGDAVISTDVLGYVTYLNAVAESMTSCMRGEAAGHPIRGSVPNHRCHHSRSRAESHGAGDSGKRDRGPHLKLRLDLPRWEVNSPSRIPPPPSTTVEDRRPALSWFFAT